jgi:hypothetical protein
VNGSPTLEIHIPISPTPTFFNMVHCLTLSLRRFGGTYANAPVILTVGDTTIDRDVARRNPWLGPLGVELRWVSEGEFRVHSYHATVNARFQHEYHSDVVLFLDADILIADSFEELIHEVHKGQVLAGMIAPASPLQFFAKPTNWSDLYRHCDIELEPKLSHEHTGWPYYFSSDAAFRYCPAYFNYGVVCAPAQLMKRISELYSGYVSKLQDLSSDFLVTQMALALVIARLDLPYKTLSLRYNFPNHPMLEALHGSEIPKAKLLHLKEDHQFHKTKVFDDLSHVRQTIRRDDLRGINRIAQRVLAAIEPQLGSDESLAA